MKYESKTTFTLILLFVTALMIYLSFQYKKGAGIVPLVIGIPTLLFFLVHFLMETGLIKKSENTGPKESNKKEAGENLFGNECRALATIAALFFLIYFIGFFIAVPLFLFVFLKVRYAESWALSITLTGSVSILLYLLFVKIVKLHLYKGIFFTS